jgi:hypothetical protein
MEIFEAIDMFEQLGPLHWSGLAKRDAFDDSIERYGGMFSSSEDVMSVLIPFVEEMYHGFDTDNSKLNLMTMPLGDLGAGT